MCMPSININVQDIFTPLLSISADIETIKLSVGLYIKFFFLREQTILGNVLAISGNRTKTENPQRRQDRNKRMKMRRAHFGVVQMYLQNKL